MKIERVDLTFRESLAPIRKVDKLVCHHPAHETWDIYDIHAYHRNTNKWNGIGYNFFITKEGTIQQGRGLHVGAHCKGFNDSTLGICFQGHFDVQEMTDEQVESGAWLCAKLIRDYGLQINDIIGHKDLAPTSCPGKNFRMNDLRTKTLEYLNPRTKATPKKKVERLYQPNSETLKKSTEYVLYRMELEGQLTDKWRKKLLAGELTESEAVGLLFTAIERGFIFNQYSSKEDEK
jgi:N-acetylmuramoyl-L-alanine amidase